MSYIFFDALMIFDLKFTGFRNDLSQKFENQLYKKYLDWNSRVDNFTKSRNFKLILNF